MAILTIIITIMMVLAHSPISLVLGMITWAICGTEGKVGGLSEFGIAVGAVIGQDSAGNLCKWAMMRMRIIAIIVVIHHHPIPNPNDTKIFNVKVIIRDSAIIIIIVIDEGWVAWGGEVVKRNWVIDVWVIIGHSIELVTVPISTLLTTNIIHEFTIMTC